MNNPEDHSVEEENLHCLLAKSHLNYCEEIDENDEIQGH